jgi:SAM-dependent methyltransferase
MNQEQDVLASYYAAIAEHYDAAVGYVEQEETDGEDDYDDEAYDDEDDDGGYHAERAAELAALRARVADLVRGHDVLELACGTGYWTAAMAQTADKVLATDAAEPMLALARRRAMPRDVVAFRQVDGHALPASLGGMAGHDCVFIGFWWSHLTRDEQDAFLAQLRTTVAKNALLVLVDDEYVEGENLPVARTDAQGNTYAIAATLDGGRVELPKNYPSDSALRKRLGGVAKEIRIERLEYYWLLTCRLK